MKNGTIFKTFFLLINLIGLSAVCYFQWKIFNIKKNEKVKIEKAVDTVAQKWDQDTGRSFVEDKNLNLTENAIPLEVIVANLAETSGSHYITVYPIVKFVNGELNKADFERALPQIRETFLEIINGKNIDELLEKDGLDKLKQDLVRELNNIALPLEVEKVYFSSAVVS